MDERPAEATGERATVFDDVACWLTIASVYFLVGVRCGRSSPA